MDPTTVQAIIVVFSIWIVIQAFNRLSTRIQKLERTLPSNDYGSIIEKIERGARHEPRPNRPALLSIDARERLERPDRAIFFDDFDWFGALLDLRVRDLPWAIEETSHNPPERQRMYKIYYNEIVMGSLSIESGTRHSDSSAEEFMKNRSAIAKLSLENLRFVGYNHAYRLLFDMELILGPHEKASAWLSNWARIFTPGGEFLIGYEPPTVAARTRAHYAATSALTSFLWDTDPSGNPYFYYRTAGPYVGLRDMIEHWKQLGIDPYEKWFGKKRTD